MGFVLQLPSCTCTVGLPSTCYKMGLGYLTSSTPLCLQDLPVPLSQLVIFNTQGTKKKKKKASAPATAFTVNNEAISL